MGSGAKTRKGASAGTGRLAAAPHATGARPAATIARSYRKGLEQAIAQACELLVSQQDPDITEALGIVGRATGASRATLWERRDGDRPWYNTHEWCAEGVKPLAQKRQGLPDWPVLHSILERGQPVVLPDVQALPPEASLARKSFNRWGIKSALAVPILSPWGELLGCVGLHDVVQSGRRRRADEVWALRVFASTVAFHWARRKSQDEAWLASERFRLLTEHSADPFAIVNEARIITYVSPAITEVLGFTPEELMGKRAASVIHPGDLPRLRRAFEVYVAKPGSHFTVEARLLHKTGSFRVVEAKIVNLVDSPAVAGVAMRLRDVTELRRLEREVAAACTTEREALRRDLHDGLQGYLTALGIATDTLVKKATAGKPISTHETARVAELVSTARQAVQDICLAIVPVPTGPSGLMRGLSRLAETTQRVTGLQVAFDCPSDVFLADASEAVQAYRIAQEAVNNAARHSGGNRIVIRLNQQDGVVTLSVEDNGKGFREASAGENGLGISIMRHRAAILNGSLDIAGAPQGGAIVTLSFTPSATEGCHRHDHHTAEQHR